MYDIYPFTMFSNHLIRPYVAYDVSLVIAYHQLIFCGVFVWVYMGEHANLITPKGGASGNLMIGNRCAMTNIYFVNLNGINYFYSRD